MLLDELGEVVEARCCDVLARLAGRWGWGGRCTDAESEEDEAEEDSEVGEEREDPHCCGRRGRAGWWGGREVWCLAVVGWLVRSLAELWWGRELHGKKS